MEDTSCELGDIFQEGSMTCAGELCLRCSGGIWEPEEPEDIESAPRGVQD